MSETRCHKPIMGLPDHLHAASKGVCHRYAGHDGACSPYGDRRAPEPAGDQKPEACDVCACGDAFADHGPECQIDGCGCTGFCWREDAPQELASSPPPTPIAPPDR